MTQGPYSLPTMLWLKYHEPETFKAAYKLMVPGGYLVARFTGEFTIDHSRASTTLLFDIRKEEWHQPFLAALDIPEEKLPRPEPSAAVVGRVTTEIVPAIQRARADGIYVEGPFPADTIFRRVEKDKFDGIINMYHDQGQVATKFRFPDLDRESAAVYGK